MNNRGLGHDRRYNRKRNTTAREDRCYPWSHRSHPCLRVRRLLCKRRSQRASCASVLYGQGNIDHKTALVKKLRAQFCSSNVARTVVPLQVAPTEVQGNNCPMLSAKITRRDSNASPCSQDCTFRADGLSRTIGTIKYGARAVQKCQLSGILPPEMPARHVDRRTKDRTQIHCSKIRTHHATGLRKHPKNWSPRNQSLRAPVGLQQWVPRRVPGATPRWYDFNLGRCPGHQAKTGMGAMATALSGHARSELPCPRRAVGMAPYPRAHKKCRPFASGHGLRGGRWPGPQVERDGLSCYCGPGWVSERSNNSMAAATSLGGIAATWVVSLTSRTRPASDRFTRDQKSFLMATFADQTTSHGRLP